MALEAPVRAADTVFQGEDKTLRFTIYQSNGRTAQDISGWSLNWLLKTHATDADGSAVITKSTAGTTITLSDPTNGICTVSILAADTASLAAGSYVHELKRMTSGSETVLSFGSFVLLQAVHRT